MGSVFGMENSISLFFVRYVGNRLLDDVRFVVGIHDWQNMSIVVVFVRLYKNYSGKCISKITLPTRELMNWSFSQ